MFWVRQNEWKSRPEAFSGFEASLIEKRFNDGAHCLIGWDHDESRVVYRLWATAGSTFVDWIFTTVQAAPRCLFIFDVFVEPAKRGRQFHWVGASHACDLAVSLGRPGIMACVEEHEYYPFAKKYASQGLGFCKPVYNLNGLGIGMLTMHSTTPPSNRSQSFFKKLYNRYHKEIE